MYLLVNTSTDPYFNLALEEYLLRHTTNDYIVLWRSNNSVVVGKHQNLHKELIETYALKQGIQISRRLSGGGTVFHDLGNVNFTYINSGKQGELVNFKRFIEPIKNFLVQLGAPAYLSERNDILIEGKKVSGNAEHVFKNRVLHHGTLLFNSDLSKLSSVLRSNTDCFLGRGVASVRKPVTCISEHIDEQMSVDGFAEALGQFLQEQFSMKNYSLSSSDEVEIQKLVQQKYYTKEWIYDYSPRFTLNKIVENQKVRVDVKAGKIERFSTCFLDSNMQKSLIGVRFEYQSLERKCESEEQRNFMELLFSE